MSTFAYGARSTMCLKDNTVQFFRWSVFYVYCLCAYSYLLYIVDAHIVRCDHVTDRRIHYESKISQLDHYYRCQFKRIEKYWTGKHVGSAFFDLKGIVITLYH